MGCSVPDDGGQLPWYEQLLMVLAAIVGASLMAAGTVRQTALVGYRWMVDRGSRLDRWWQLSQLVQSLMVAADLAG